MTTRTTRYLLRLTTPRTLLLLATVFVLVVQTVWFVRSASTRGFATGDAGVKLWQVQGILRSGDFNAPLVYSGARYDPDHLYAPFIEPWAFWKDGQFYSEYTSPFIWASVPLYAVLGHAGLMILPWLCGMLLIGMSAWLAWRTRSATPRSAACVPLIVGFASPLLIYSLEFWEHTPGTALAVFALVGVVKALDSKRRGGWLIASGAAIGLSLTMRAELYVYPIALIIGLLFIRTTLPLVRSLVWLAVGGLIMAGPWWLYQFVTWGSPFGPRLQQNLPVLGGTEMLARLGDSTGRNYAMLWPAASHVTLLLLLALVFVAALTWILKHKLAWASAVGFWLEIILLLVLAGLLVLQLAQGHRPDDLLTTFPIVLLLLLPIPRLNQPPATNNRQPQALIRFLAVVPLAFVALVILVSPFQGGIQWGPRFLLPIIPPLTSVVIDRLTNPWRTLARAARVGLAAALIALVVVGSYSTWLGVKFIQEGQTASEFMSEVIRQSPEKVVVADVWFLPQMAPYLLNEKIWLMAEDEQKMFRLLQMLRKQTNEPGFVYTSALTWTHIDPQALMGPRIVPLGDSQKVYVNAPTQYVELSQYQLLK